MTANIKGKNNQLERQSCCITWSLHWSPGLELWSPWAAPVQTPSVLPWGRAHCEHGSSLPCTCTTHHAAWPKVQQHHWSTMSVLMCVCFRACMLLLPEGKWQAMHTVCMQAVLKVQRCAQEGDHLVTRQIQLSAGRSGGGEEEEKGEEEGEEHRLCNWMPMQTNGRPVNTDRHRCVAKSSSKVERQHTQHRFCGGEVGPQLKSLSTVAGTGVQQRCDSHHGVDMIHSNL